MAVLQCHHGAVLLWDTVLTGPSLVAASPDESELSQVAILWPILCFAAKSGCRTCMVTTRHLLTYFCLAGPTAFPSRGSKTQGTEVVCAVWGAGAAQETTLPGPLHGTETST